MKLNHTESIAVDVKYHWQSIKKAPIGVKLQLLTIGGVAVHGVLTQSNKNHFIAFTPLPKKVKNG